MAGEININNTSRSSYDMGNDSDSASPPHRKRPRLDARGRPSIFGGFIAADADDSEAITNTQEQSDNISTSTNDGSDVEPADANQDHDANDQQSSSTSSSPDDGSDIEPADANQDADAATSDAESCDPEDVQDPPDFSDGADDVDKRGIRPLIPLDERVVIDANKDTMVHLKLANGRSGQTCSFHVPMSLLTAASGLFRARLSDRWLQIQPRILDLSKEPITDNDTLAFRFIHDWLHEDFWSYIDDSMDPCSHFEILPKKHFAYTKGDPKVVYKYRSVKDFVIVMGLANFLVMPMLQNYILTLVHALRYNNFYNGWIWDWRFARTIITRLPDHQALSRWAADWIVMMNVPHHEPAEWIYGQPEKVKDTVLLAYARREDLHGHARRCPSIRDEECDAVKCTEDWMNLPSPEEYYVEDLPEPDYEGSVVLRLRVLRSLVKDDEFNVRWNGILRYVCVLGDSSQSSHDTSDRHEESSDENSPNGSANAARDNGDGEEAESDASASSSSSSADSNNSDPSPQAPSAPRQRRLPAIPMALSTEVTICRLLRGSLTAGPLSIRQSTWLGKLNPGLLKACNYHQRYAQGFAAANASDESLIPSEEENRKRAIKSDKRDKLPSLEEIRKPAIWHGWICRYMKYAFRDRTTRETW